MKILGAIPARAGSERLPGKNTREFAGKTLVQWAEHRAHLSKVFDKVIISTDNPVLRKLYPETDIITRPESISQSTSIDYEWVKHAMDELNWEYDLIAILRPTSPFRSVETIIRSYELAILSIQTGCESMRAVQVVKERPEKMWKYNEESRLIFPYMDSPNVNERLYEMQSKSFRTLYIQNGCIEWTTKKTLKNWENVSGCMIEPFLTRGYEGFDINTQDDFDYAKYLVESGKVVM